MGISDYGFLSDCQSIALVDTSGSVDWYCLPRLDSPSVFGRLLGTSAGHWRIRPLGTFRAQRAYLADSLVLRTEFTTPDGSVALTDTLLFERGARGHDVGLRVPHVLMRRVDGLRGDVEMEMELAPRFEYGLTASRFAHQDGRYIARGGEIVLTLETDAPVSLEGSAARSRFRLRAGQSLTFRLGYREALSSDQPCPAAEGSIEDTLEGWRSWAALHRGYKGLYLENVRLSALVLQGLTFQPTGALAAAGTTSLPEVLGRTWNWDYRFAWLRDASLTMFAQWVAACPHEPTRFFDWLCRAGGPLSEQTVQIVFGVTGRRDLTEHSLPHLEGFADSSPVRVGNDAWMQRQLDVLGEVLDAAYLLRDQLGPMDAETRELLVGYADRAEREWREPDAGMWEARDEERHYTSSKVMCWVALDRAVKLAERLEAESRIGRWVRARAEVKERVLAEAWNDDLGAFAGALGSDRLDASVLLLPLVGFIDATDERMRATIRAIEERLRVDGLVRRWDGEPNGFLICSYWLSECLVLAGEVERGARLFERTTALANDLGLLSEEAGIGTGELLGNFPQAFSHVGLINAAWRLTLARQGPSAAGGGERPGVPETGRG